MRWLKLGGFGIGTLLIIAFGGISVVASKQAEQLIYHPLAERPPLEETPADYALVYKDVSLTTSDGLDLAAWYIPSQNGAAVIVQHGYKSNRSEVLGVAEILARHGYGVMMTDQRAHGESEGELISFGKYELLDLEAAFEYVVAQPDVDPDRVGALGNSMGSSTVLLYTAQNPAIRAVVAHSPFSSLRDIVETSVTYFTGLPSFPFAPLIVFFAEREINASIDEIAAVDHVGSISPRPVFILDGGADVAISSQSGERLFEAANEPKEWWFDPDIGHVQFTTKFPAEFERRVVEFFDKYLLSDS